MKISKIKLSGKPIMQLTDKDQSSDHLDNSTEDYNLKEKFVIQSPLRSGENERSLEVKAGEVYELDFDDDTFWIGDA